MADKTAIATDEGNLDKKALKEIHAKLQPIADRSPMVDSRNLALLNMRLIEVLLNEKPTTDLPQRHHG